MKNRIKGIISLWIVIVMMVGMLPLGIASSAAGEEYDASSPEWDAILDGNHAVGESITLVTHAVLDLTNCKASEVTIRLRDAYDYYCMRRIAENVPSTMTVKTDASGYEVVLNGGVARIVDITHDHRYAFFDENSDDLNIGYAAGGLMRGQGVGEFGVHDGKL